MGLIAQETETIIPEVVHSNGEYKSVMYSNLIGPIVESIKDLNHKHSSLEGRQTTLEGEIATIKTSIKENLKKLNKIKNLVDVK